MAAAVALSNYQLGDLLGRGASGSVYRALNFLTGETVAIKSVSLLTLAPSSLPDIMSEIDLLKNLNHPNIVKYKGFARDKDNLFIVLEYCENGSLQTILKKFGKFPESLVAVYISQVLEGLIYLHEQGVVHRDIKGANILTNKDGSVKLADFGVSSRTAGPALEGNDNEVVGSPYWMAPEVIEQSGASTASDIWSVGCVVVELLEGKPPHGELAPMQALWRIVQDESMKIPDGASPIVRDFLLHCFQKDPNLRVSAKKLARHPWMLSARRTLATSPPPSRPESRVPSATEPKPKGSVRVPSNESRTRDGRLEGGDTRGAALTAAETGTVRPKKPLTVYDEAVQRVQEWNEALNASPKALGTMRRLPPNQPSQPRKLSVAQRPRPDTQNQHHGLFSLPALAPRSSVESLTAQPSSSSNPSPAHHPGIMHKNMHVSDVLSRARESAGESWDDDFAADISLSKLGYRKEDNVNANVNANVNVTEEPDQMTLRPTKSPKSTAQTQRQKPGSEASPSRGGSGSRPEDYSDIALGDSMTDLDKKLADLKLKNKTRRGIMHPDDLRKLRITESLPAPIPQRIPSALPTPVTPITPATPPRAQSARSAVPSGIASPGLIPPQSPKPPMKSPPSSRQNSLRSREPSESQLELQKYTEEEDEDYSDMFEGQQGQETIGSRSTTSLQLTRRSNRSWLGDEEGDQSDPFAEIDDELEFGADDIAANLLRDKRATLCASVSRLIEKLDPTAGTAGGGLRETCDELLGMLEGSPEMGLESHFVASHGMLAVLEVLESRLSRDVAVRLLKIVNLIVGTDVDMLESFCLIGGIPVIIPYTSRKHSLETRLEASTFIQQLTRSAITLQMFISCRGLRILVELLDEDYSVNRTLILSSLEGIGSVFDLQSPTPRNDFCRMFVREGILDPLSTALLAILRDETIEDEESSTRAINVLLLFCQVAQADGRVRDAFATRTIMIRLLKACDLLPRKLLVTAIKAIKHLSTSPQLIEVLQNSNAMEILVALLGKSIKGTHANEICSHIFQTIYSMCRLSKARQEEAASSGLIPLLKKVIQNKSPLKQFALPILCDLANAGKASRRLLWQNEGMKLYLDLLEDPYWRVSALDAVLAWMQDETARVEEVLLEKSASDRLVRCFVQASGISFEEILDSYLKIFRLSSSLTMSLSTPTFFRRLSDALSTKSKAVAKLNLLRITRVACEHHPDRATLVARFSLASIVDRLAKQDEAILVRELAKEIHPTLLFGGDISSSFEEGGTGRSGVGTGMGSGVAGSREVEGRTGLVGKRISSMRRTTSESVVDVGSYRDRQEAHNREGTQGKEREVKLRQTVGRASGGRGEGRAKAQEEDIEVAIEGGPVANR
ncbi:non-specific serine/threonine protein kinase [Saitozyma sp. JCM 24511]|nr:non-specific serine/threonine protein kinase [Saitozyma sp. JCM 24511]